LAQLAADTGLDSATFNACIQSQDALKRAQADAATGTQLGLNGTPGIVINGKVAFPGYPTEAAFRKALDDAIAANP
jgi:predicted DsbA family dithiol-disulfide isomerase